MKEHRDSFDPKILRDWVKENSIVAFNNVLNKIETHDFKLKAKDIALDDRAVSIKEQKQAILDREDITHPLKATLQLIKKSDGSVVDEKKAIVARIPHITERQTVILNGTEYTPIIQQKVKPGIYSRQTESGLGESWFNVKAGTGLALRIIFTPASALFTLKVKTTNIPLYGLLKDLWNVSDSEIERYWGKDIANKNKSNYKGNEIDKFYNIVFSY